MNKLKKWRTENGYTQSSFGALIGKSQAAIERYENGKRKPEPDVAENIERVTSGAVTLYDLMGIKPFEQGNSPNPASVSDEANNVRTAESQLQS